jgi:HAD superfamily hydrolase (TIGR01509 family)
VVRRRDFVLPGEFKAAVFDFDGLLVDSEPGWRRAEALLLARHGGIYTEADSRAAIGRSIDQSVIEYADRLGLPSDELVALRAELRDLAREEYLDGFPLCPGAPELVVALGRHIRLALASNSDRSLIELGLSLSPFEGSFDVVVTRDDVDRPKPAPDLYALACRLLGVQPRDAVAFEDSVSGIAAAKMAGLTVVAVRQLPGPDLEAADIVVHSLADLVVG